MAIRRGASASATAYLPGPATQQGPMGNTGAVGPSAYQAWLAAGNVGPIGAFLASLVGPVGPACALAIGTVATGAPGTEASATVSGAAPNQILSLTIPRGDTGAPGPANTLAIGGVTTGAPGSVAAATISGAAPSQTLDLTIPRGDTGATGPANSLAVGAVTTGAPGSAASATVSGAAPNQTLDLMIPRGATGATGPANALAIGSVATGAPGSAAAAAITGTAPNQTLALTIPKGDTGATGGPGPANSLTVGTVTTGAAGSGASATVTGVAPNQTLNLTIPRGDTGPEGGIGPVGTLAYHLDGIPFSALLSAPRGVAKLQGADVAITSLLTHSSVAKYTTGADGLPLYNAPNTAAWDWSTGRRRMLVEAIPGTNYWPNSEDATAWTSQSGFTASNNANGFGALNKALLTATAANAYSQYSISVAAGQQVSLTLALSAGNRSSAFLYIYGGNTGNLFGGVAKILSGPGVVSLGSGGGIKVTGLTAATTIVRLTLTSPVAQTCYPTVAMVDYVGATPGDTLYVGTPQIEYGPGSSYIPCGASPTTRTGDVVTVASGVRDLLTLQGPGQLGAALGLYGTRLAGVGLLGAQSQYAGIALNAYGTTVNANDDAGNNISIPNGGASIDDFGLAITYGPGGRRAALNGGAVASDAHTLFAATDTALQLGGAPIYGLGNLLLDGFRVFSFAGSAAGLQAQSGAGA